MFATQCSTNVDSKSAALIKGMEKEVKEFELKSSKIDEVQQNTIILVKKTLTDAYTEICGTTE